jgi:hypothetical protein
MKADSVVKKHVFNFSPKENGGESLILSTNLIANGDPGVFFYNQEFILYSYCNCASINLYSISITPDKLRKLADELELAEKEAKEILMSCSD